MLVKLTRQEMIQAALAGVIRQIEALDWGCPDQEGLAVGQWEIHILGALGELAAAKALGVYCCPASGDFKTRPDLPGWEVRTTTHKTGRLRLTRRDDPGKRFILVTGSGPAFRVVGWILGREGMQNQFWGTADPKRPPCWWVPQDKLKPIRGGVGNGKDFVG